MSRLLLIKTLLAVTILNIPFKAWSQTITITDTNPQIICPGVTLTINFTHANIAQGNVFTVMISDQNGSFVNPLTSTLIQNNTATSATLTIPANATSGSGYYLKVVSSIDYTSDTKPIRIGVPTPYIVNQALYCPDGTITLQVKLSSDTPFPEGYTFQWFKDNVAIANESLSYDTYFKGHAPTNADAGNYQVKASAPAGACSAMSAPVNMLMLASSRTPLVSVSPGTILSGSTATLTATGCSGEVSWYNSYTSYHPTETSYQSPYTFITAEITKDKTYYVSCTENNDCPSAKVPFTVKSDTTQAPQPPSLSASANNFCYSTVSTVTISAANCEGVVRWYKNTYADVIELLETDENAPFEYVMTSPDIRTYYADCRRNGVLSTSRASIKLNIKPWTDSPSLFPYSITVNYGSDVTLYAKGCENGTINWYDNYFVRNVIHTGSSFNKANITQSSSFFCSCVVNGCESYLMAAYVYIPRSGAPEQPTLYVSNSTVCGTESRTITAIGCSQGVVNWYNQPTGGNLLGTGQTFTTTISYNPLGSNYSYYADCTISGSSPSNRGEISFTVLEAPNIPVPASTHIITACGMSPSLSASGCNGTVRWYTHSTEVGFETGTTFQAYGNSTIYYVSCYINGGCESVRVPVYITYLCPSTPIINTIGGNSVCKGSSITLTATGCNGAIVLWSDGGTGNNRVITPNENFTLAASCTINYYTTPQSNTLPVSVIPKPVLSITNPSSVTYPATINLTSPAITTGSFLPSGTILSYYTDIAGNIPLSNPSAIVSSGTYYVKASNMGNCKDIKSVLVKVSNCNASLNLISTQDDYMSGLQIKNTSQNITATNKITGEANVIYRSGKSIILNQGFKAEKGTILKAEIGNCD